MFMSRFKTQVKLNVLPLGSYDVLIGMDWLEKHRVFLNCFEKTFTCLDEKGELVIVKGKARKVYVRQISSLQMKKYLHKECKVFAIMLVNVGIYIVVVSYHAGECKCCSFLTWCWTCSSHGQM